MSKGVEDGMQTFDQSLFSLYKSGRISLTEALRNADSHTDLALRARLTDPHPQSGVPLTVTDGQGFPHSRK
jgi:twitching motility protein PilU